MSAENVFYASLCAIPAVEALPPYYAIGNRYVPYAPPDILDCVESLPPAPPPEAPCPVLGPYTQESKASFAASNQPVIGRLDIRKTACCEFDFDLDLQVPCPPLGPPTQTVNAPFVDGPTQLTVNIYQVDRNVADAGYTDYCAWDFDFDLQAHCPVITSKTTDAEVPFTTKTTTGKATLAITRDDEACNFDFDLDLTVPCPTINTSLKVTAATPETVPTGKFTATRSEACEFDLDLELTIPQPCVPGLSFDVTTSEGPTGSASFDVTEVGDCDLLVTADIVFPCPTTVSGGAATVTCLSAGAKPTASIDVAPDGDCGVIISMSLGIPCLGGGGSGGGSVGSGSGGAGCSGVLVSEIIQCTYEGTEIRDACLTIFQGQLVLVDADGNILAGGG